ncbi:hypothetical protein COY28_00495 [Candidatus Woesearchaeota archaeon CG_4_10_14_0_2_um_filter_57_5]|nr:MAG: hypothetical protein AUJ68_05265 [Candidatus Woesearchaeota archaeon CG1_02_57_44]PIN68473.1 MAG: hypothetical protein COV94_04460 [Candidatus Woesearchaeota archaeon CG11_big_fil_rev_8_21_14_0_20_57_5]PIZ56908.1 MAG: hypothetical protein COY28_00495 [Candidatus Woesearchaeota archaeon CG_4_10_14_0_2_um_filter_57_5]
MAAVTTDSHAVGLEPNGIGFYVISSRFPNGHLFFHYAYDGMDVEDLGVFHRLFPQAGLTVLSAAVPDNQKIPMLEQLAQNADAYHQVVCDRVSPQALWGTYHEDLPGPYAAALPALEADLLEAERREDRSRAEVLLAELTSAELLARRAGYNTHDMPIVIQGHDIYLHGQHRM